MNIDSSFVLDTPFVSLPEAALPKAGVHRGRKVITFIMDMHDTYNLIEAGCLLIAAGFSAVVTAMAFGVRF